MFKYIKATYYEDENFEITLEEADGNLMAHVVIYHFNNKIYDDLFSKWDEIREKAYWQGYEDIYTYTQDDRIARLMKHEGEPIGEFTKGGQTFKVWKWDLRSDWESLPLRSA